MATKYTGKYPNRIKMVVGTDGGKKYVFVTNAGNRFEATTAQLRARGFVNAPPALGTEIAAVIDGYAPNPIAKKRISRTNITPEQYVKRPSQITRAAPTKRAKARRQTHLDSGLPPGYYPNPIHAARFVIEFNAGNDRNGNPRGGYLVVELTGIDRGPEAQALKIVQWVDHGYAGKNNLKKFGFESLPSMGVFPLSASEVKAFQNSYRVGYAE